MQDRVPPQNIEAEQSVLGAMLIDNTAAISVTEMLSKKDSDLKSLQMYFRINYATLPGCLKILSGLIFILGNAPAVFVQPAQSI